MRANPMPDNLPDLVHHSFQLWAKDPIEGLPLGRLYVVRRDALGGNLRRATNRILSAALDQLALEYPDDAALLRDRYVTGRSVSEVARARHLAEVTIYKTQNRAVARVAAIVWNMELAALADRAAVLASRLPPAHYDEVFGIDARLAELARALATPAAPWIIAVEGLGGIGKTTLAHRLVNQLAQDVVTFTDFAWVSAQQQQFRVDRGKVDVAAPALTADALIEALAAQLLAGQAAPVSVERALVALEPLLRRTPHLVVIDNLETVADVEALLPMLSRLCGPTKFLLTSREAISHLGIARYPVPELAQDGALALVRHEAALRGLAHVSDASDDDLAPIYAAVGGNPLALRLVTGQLHLLSLPEVLESLREARGRRIEEMYSYVYWRAWHTLTPAAQDTLLLMPVFSHIGGDLAAITELSDLPAGELVDALALLVKLSLVNVTGDLRTRRYSIHRLTETFLLKEVLKWRGQAADA